MTQQAVPLSYAGPMTIERSVPPARAVPWYLVLTASIATGVVGANNFADAAGFPPVHSADRDPGYVFFRVLCGMIVAGLTAAVILSAGRLVRALLANLSATKRRPETAIIITLIICGAACLLGAVALPLYFAHNSAASIVMTTDNEPSVRMGVPMPMISVLAIIATAAGGVILLAIGIWGSLRPHTDAA